MVSVSLMPRPRCPPPSSTLLTFSSRTTEIFPFSIHTRSGKGGDVSRLTIHYTIQTNLFYPSPPALHTHIAPAYHVQPYPAPDTSQTTYLPRQRPSLTRPKLGGGVVRPASQPVSHQSHRGPRGWRAAGCQSVSGAVGLHASHLCGG
ncbi:uncharacterized protein BDW47DRAFT_103035 [Aspergillus candidus]|uniref:Uncharacterized protein n=1 Tax=Aspergillus candidus TaxID=41067 RepID=A0A2I2FFM6_ASPCN|nr:hypothetical protein BDW47DRAFT_103035 [Aspergillus candidus]PLB39424.1 hypothetical protein BDW47DRAFT_103035 [Aspergillus candidus]